MLSFCHGEIYYKRDVIWLYLCFGGGAVSSDLAAFLTFVDYYKSLFRICFGCYRHKYAAACVCSVSGVYIDMKRAKALRAMIAR